MEETGERWRRYGHVPIPTYDEATSSRPNASSQNHRGAQEISDDAERQELLRDGEASAHLQPTVESPRSSEDSDLGLPEVVFGDTDDARRHIEELDYLEPDNDSQRSLYHRARLRTHWSKHLANISATFSSIRLPSLRSFYSPISSAENSGDEEQPPTTPSGPSLQPAPSQSRIWPGRFPRAFQLSERYRMSLPVFARLCGLFTLAAVVYVLVALDMFPGAAHRMGSHYDPESVRVFAQDSVDPDRLRGYLEHISSYDHVAGTEGDYYLANWMQDEWILGEAFDEIAMLDYHVYLNYPTHDGRSIKIVDPPGRRWKAQIEENLVDQTRQQTQAWHGHSKSGEATGHLIYANGGSRDDFKWLQDHGVETEGAIALVRYYGTQDDRGSKIRAAEHAGCIGVIMYTDPSDDGAGKGHVWPEGPWRPADSVQRGSVSLMSWIIGDPLTPGWASKKNTKTITKESSPALPKIPSLPLPWRDARVLLDALNGQGIEVPQSWIGGAGNNDKWFTGSKSSDHAVKVELRNHNDENEKQQIWNVHGLIQGLEQPKKKVIVGNHRDAWCFGAVDPGSGSAVMMEVVAIFATLMKAGWRPLRSIEFVSWDAEEFNLMGSTEYVEEKIDYLRDNGVAYLNVGAGVYGPNFHAAASPLIRKSLLRVLNRVMDPRKNDTLHDLWLKTSQDVEAVDASAGGGDSVPFQTIAGMSSIDFGFRGREHAFPYHSCYETFEWMEKFGDPNFSYHSTLAQIWTLLILEMADRPLIPFNLKFYATQITRYVARLEQDALKAYSQQRSGEKVTPSLLRDEEGFTIAPLHSAVENLTFHVRTFHSFEDEWSKNVRWAGGLESAVFSTRRTKFNDKIAHFETDLLDLPQGKHDREIHGIPGREQFKHVLFGPRLWGNGGGEDATFPAVRDAFEEGDWEEAMRLVERAAEVLEKAGKKLVE